MAYVTDGLALIVAQQILHVCTNIEVNSHRSPYCLAKNDSSIASAIFNSLVLMSNRWTAE